MDQFIIPLAFIAVKAILTVVLIKTINKKK